LLDFSRLVLVEPTGTPEATSVLITRLVCITLVVMTTLVGAGVLLILHPEHASVAFALIGVVIGASFGLVTPSRPRRR
jgi:hypothetical protein